MSSIKKTEKFIRNAEVHSDLNMNQKVLEELLKELPETQQQEQTAQIKPNFWRIIMKSNITKIAAAVVIIGLVVIGVTLVEKTTTPAYAVEQTIEVMQKVTTAHCFIKDFNQERIELWIGVNPETGANEKIYTDSSRETRVTTPIESYVYDKNTNTVRHSKGSLDRSDIRFGRFIEDFFGIAKAMNADIKKSEKIEGKKKVILLVLETKQFTLESRINPVTKLPISMQMIPKGELQPGQLGLSVEDITYNSPLPEGIFDFKIPEGAQVIEQ
jgi:hypothetical protein